MLISGGRTKTATKTTATSTSHRVAGRRRTATAMLLDQVEGSTPAGLVKEVNHNVEVERQLFTEPFLFVLVIRLDERPVDEERPADEVRSWHKSPVAAVEGDSAIVAHSE